MIDIATITETELRGTLRLLRAEIIKRGWQATTPYIGSPHFYIDRGDGELFHIFSATPPTTSYAAAHLANDKYAAHQVLQGVGIPQLATVLVEADNSEAIDLINKVGKVVVKPVDGGHGDGISVNVTTHDQLMSAMAIAKQYSSSRKQAIVQTQFDHQSIRDIRVLCINFKYIAALMRVPARVFGDGTSTVAELMNQENASSKRGEAYKAPLTSIDMDRAAQFLGDKINSIPPEGEEVWVLGIANYGAGGELIDVSDDLPTWLIDEAQKAAEVTELPVAGVDFMMSAVPHRTMQRDEVDAVIVEINKCPSLSIHDEPTFGKSRGVIVAYVDYLATL